jgi:hypothetical protein
MLIMCICLTKAQKPRDKGDRRGGLVDRKKHKDVEIRYNLEKKYLEAL